MLMTDAGYLLLGLIERCVFEISQNDYTVRKLSINKHFFLRVLNLSLELKYV